MGVPRVHVHEVGIHGLGKSLDLSLTFGRGIADGIVLADKQVLPLEQLGLLR